MESLAARMDACLMLDGARTVVPMQLNNDDVSEFATLWQKELNEALSDGEAKHQASLLMELYELLARTPPAEEGEAWPNADPLAP